MGIEEKELAYFGYVVRLRLLHLRQELPRKIASLRDATPLSHTLAELV